MVWPNIHAAYDRRIEPEVLLHGSPATILDRGAALDDKGDRGGPTLGRLLEGVSHERARCLRGIPIAELPLIAGRSRLNAKLSARSPTVGQALRVPDDEAVPLIGTIG